MRISSSAVSPENNLEAFFNGRNVIVTTSHVTLLLNRKLLRLSTWSLSRFGSTRLFEFSSIVSRNLSRLRHSVVQSARLLIRHGKHIDYSSTAFCPPKKEEHIGNKAGGLSLCTKLGINLPRWFVIPAEAASAQRWRTDALFRGELLTLAMQLHVRDQGLVVRSSTELEDSDQSTHAGEFLTEKIVLLRPDSLH